MRVKAVKLMAAVFAVLSLTVVGVGVSTGVAAAAPAGCPGGPCFPGGNPSQCC
jgi:hypothetical protein